MWDIVKLDYVAIMWHVGHLYWGDRSLFSHSMAFLSLGPLFFGGCPELVDGLGVTDAY